MKPIIIAVLSLSSTLFFAQENTTKVKASHLSIINKKEDFGLTYLLIVSAIEVIAQNAIKREAVKINNPSEKEWKAMAKADKLFDELYKVYKDAKGKNQYLKERFVEFIFQYAPVEKWNQIVDHPFQDLEDFLNEIYSEKINYLTKKNWNEMYPDDFEIETLKKIIGDSYTYRSKFVHRGKQPPHQNPLRYNKFFEEINTINFDNYTHEKKYLANYELLLMTHKYTLINWLRK